VYGNRGRFVGEKNIGGTVPESSCHNTICLRTNAGAAVMIHPEIVPHLMGHSSPHC